jgi:AcrR family transcriptional regulator
MSGRAPKDTMPETKSRNTDKTYTISLAHRKARGSGHERLAEILTAARGLFLEHGFENVSTRKIAQQVGISQTALFSYYKTKDEILSHLIRDAFEELGRALDEVDRKAADNRDWLRRGIGDYIRFGLNHADEYRLAFMVIRPYRRPYNVEPSDFSSEGSFYEGIGLTVFLRFHARVDQAMGEGVIRSDMGSSMLITKTLWASIHGLVAILIARPRPPLPWEPLEDLITAQTEMLLNGVLAT